VFGRLAVPEGSATLRGKRIVLIDRRDHWRARFSRALDEAGAEVEAADHYDYAAAGRRSGRRPDLVVVLSTAVTPAEVALVREIGTHGDDILVLPGSLSPQAMRELFRAGALDVTEMPVSPRELVELVAWTSKNAVAAREHKATALAGL
jgi:DNA-binding NtrC family response regulator